MQKEFPVIVKYKKLVAILNICLGGVNLFLALWLMLLTGRPNVTLFTGLVLLVLGILWLTRPLAVIHHDRIELMNMFSGNPARTYSYNRENVEITKSRVLVNSKAVLANWLTDLDTQAVRELVFGAAIAP
jgi:hypothetical protein